MPRKSKFQPLHPLLSEVVQKKTERHQQDAALAKALQKMLGRPLNPQKIGEYLFLHMADLSIEYGVLILMDNRSVLLQVTRLNTGTTNQVAAPVRAMAETALHCHGARRLIFVHNHPTCFGGPSPNDMMLHNYVSTVMPLLGFKYDDSWVVNLSGVISLARLRKPVDAPHMMTVDWFNDACCLDLKDDTENPDNWLDGLVNTH